MNTEESNKNIEIIHIIADDIIDSIKTMLRREWNDSFTTLNEEEYYKRYYGHELFIIKYLQDKINGELK